MSEEGKLMALAQAFQELLREKNLSVNAAARRWRVSREVLWKMEDGIRPQLGWLEDWARKVGEPVGKWRALAGYDVESPDLVAEIDRIRRETGADFSVMAHELQKAKESPEAYAALIAALEKRARAQKKRN